ncbi:DUF4132 domain-containing protein [Sporomusa sphaeroides]|uniref:DUF4132 domain-containing protein n=1 Tax=Sporomusa sphaeroides TaxID=47679 RepID=UPI0031588277
MEKQKTPIKNLTSEEKFKADSQKIRGKAGSIAKEIWGAYKNLARISSEYRWEGKGSFAELHMAYTALCGMRAENANTFAEFWNSKFENALEQLFGQEETRYLQDICTLVFEAPYAHSIYRPSYRSRRAGNYADNFFMAIIQEVDYLFYELNLADIIRNNFTEICGFDNRLALALKSGEQEVAALTREAIMGDGEIKLSHPIIVGVIKSGVTEQLENLGKLLLAAKGQEGIRQAILENADCGSPAAHAYFIKLILDNNLARFSSVIRAVGTWTGLAYDNAKPAVIDKCIRLAYHHLSDNAAFDAGLNSADTLEIYMALWAAAARDIYSAKAGAEGLVDVPEKYRRLTGWYFLYSTIHNKIIHEIAMQHIDIREPEELAWICCCLYKDSEAASVRWNWHNEGTMKSFPDIMFSEERCVRQEQFQKLCAVLDFIGNKKTKFDASVFPWMWVQLEPLDAAKCLVGLAGYDRDPAMIQKLAAYLPVTDADTRRAFYINLLDPGIPKERKLLLSGLTDKSPTIKGDIVKRLGKESLRPADVEFLTATFTTQSAGLRKAVMSLLGNQQEGLIRPAIHDLINSGHDKKLLAGVELLAVFGERNPQLLTEYDAKIRALGGKENLPQDVSVLLKRFNQDKTTDDYTSENGFGLYNPAAPDFDKVLWAEKRPKVKLYSKKELAKLLLPKEEDWSRIIVPLNEVLIKNKGRECEVELYDGRRTEVVIGDNRYWLPLLPGASRIGGRVNNIYDYYLADEIMAVFDSLDVSPLTLAAVICYGQGGLSYCSEFTPAAKKIFGGLPFENSHLDFDKYVEPYAGVIHNIMRSILAVRHDGVFDFAMSVWVSLVSLIPETDYMTAYQTKSAYSYSSREEAACMLGIGIIAAWRLLAHRFIETDEDFAAFWQEMWYEYLVTDKKYQPLYDRLDILRAYRLGIISDQGLFGTLLAGANAGEYIRFFTNGGKIQKEATEQYAFFTAYIDKAVERIVTVEEKRGELPTPLSSVASQIGHFKGGAKHFAALLTALGKDNFHRGYVWQGHDQTKKTTLSVLMKNCYPLSSDTYESFGAAVKAAGISDKRLLQAVMYAPQWADLAEKSTGIPGLASAVWLFHAHVNERFSAEKETKVALYSPISQQQFADGTFDKEWFLQSYRAVGETCFNELYKNAKYITDSNSAHRRSQLYTDAVLGRLDKLATMAEITDKRNQEKLRAYALIPLDDKNPGDALERYEFIQRFAKESKKFGAQRRTSEEKAVGIALQNLALTTGFGDADRMSWYLESEKMDSLRPLMQPGNIDGVDVWLNIAEDGTPALGAAKDGKPLKSLPKTLKKHKTVVEIQAAVKDLRDQKKRAKLGFELAMVSRTAFGAREILRLLQHPVLEAMVGSLVFMSGSCFGFPKSDDGYLYLLSHDGTASKLSAAAQVSIAHPYDLLQRKSWGSYQQYLYKHRIIQPFKQVFREYYPVTEDELAAVNISRRYAGHQVQPQKTLALLKTRGWTVDYEEGLQRVYHRENLIARMYAMADWFSPADIEAPTLEVVRFYSRDKDELLAFEDVPPVIFSEVMRDIDLVVAVAHVGGVDPEVSHSTVEMRIAIARELLALLSVDNVSFQTAHAMIKGSMGDYSVHMGSGVIHQSGAGMLAVLPVHSQARGRIFLPFADDDPRTAEIMSKILLFADDKKIKDPAILRQLQ